MSKIDAFFKVANQCLKIVKNSDQLYKKKGNGIKEGLDLFVSRLPLLKIIHELSADYSKIDESAAKICIEITKTSVLCLSHTVDIETQINWHKAALEAARKLGDPRNIYLTANNLAIALTDTKREKEAIEILQECLDITDSQSLKDKSGKAKVLNNLGIAYKNIGQYSKAIECYNKKLKIVKSIPNELLEVSALGNLGIVHKEKKDYDEAKKYHELRLKLAKKLNNPILISNAYGDLGITYRHNNDLDKSIEYLKKQLRLTRKHEIQNGEGRALRELSQSLYLQGKIREAIINAKKALIIKKGKKDPSVSEIQKTLLEWINESC